MARSDEELEAFLLDLESDQVERKASFSDASRVCQAICAFSNDMPDHRTSGVIFIGADDKSGQPVGLEISDRLLLNLAALRDQGEVLPRPSMVVRKRNLLGQDVAVAEVEPSSTPPVRYKGQVWIRVGPRRAIATADDERRLNERRRAADLPFDSCPVEGATPQDLDLELFVREYLPSAVAPEVLIENGRSVTDQLAALRLATVGGTPTVAGVIVVGSQPTEWVPGAYLQFIRAEGDDLTSTIVDEKRLDESLVDVLRQTDDLLRLNIRSTVEFATEDREIRRPEYPIAALQQLVRNALLHRSYETTAAPVRLTWYSDRVEITSPGGPFGTVNAENFGRPGVTDYRNPTLAEAMRTLGYVQRFGAGIQIARKALADNGNPPVEFDVQPTFVGVTIRSADDPASGRLLQ